MHRAAATAGTPASSNKAAMVLRCSIAVMLLCGSTAGFQAPQPDRTTPPAAGSAQAAQETAGEAKTGAANELVRSTVKNELKAMDEDHSHWMYRLETQKAGTKETKDVVETKDGDLTRLVARNGQPLSPQEQQVEDQRLEKFINDPKERQKQQQDANEDTRKTRSLLALLPDALTYSEPETSGNIAKLKFQPNPDFHPPSREARVFHAMEGELAIDTKHQRVVEFGGELRNAVDFGGGLLGHLDQGGTFDVRQEEVAPNHWEIVLLKINMKGKALFFKTISVQQDERHSGFRRVPDTLTLAQAEDLLRNAKERPDSAAGQ